ncbi:AI-2E family transporter [Demequina lutea]|uniref:Putative PurR-regulated permease PerM n=1 Tax=Demequina lutea TaxID=431489 RepID=A0A7Y9ZBV5_9MICO|nr:AI-2E family transporter [Demequina lutea]NYI42306.1 putative PurR-regulated permease PerM [Demequina lutea]
MAGSEEITGDQAGVSNGVEEPLKPAAPADVASEVPEPLRVAAAWAWRLIVVGVVLIAIGNVLALLSPVVLPLVIALLIAAPLERFVSFLHRLKVPRTLGAALTVLLLFFAVVGLATAVGTSVVSGFDSLKTSASRGFDTLVNWLVAGPLHVSSDQINTGVAQIMTTVRDHAWGLASSAVSVTSTVGALVAGVVLALISLFFFLRDGSQMWEFFVRLAPRRMRKSMDRAGRAGWTTLGRYTQTSAFVALVDAVGIGLGAQLLGLPLALPIGIMVFLFSFIPMFGASISGAVAVLVGLVDGGWVTALLMVGVVLFVQQTEGSILYPWLFGKAASVHPMAILVAVSSGTLLAGLAGAVIAVPILAFSVAFGRGLHAEYILNRDGERTLTGSIPLLAEKSMDAIRKATARVTTSQIRVRKRRR